MKILSIDLGRKRVGLAACDALQITTRHLPILAFSNFKKLTRQILNLVEEENFKKVLIGLPLKMNQEEGEAALFSKKFAEELKKTFESETIDCEVLLWDERLTSYEAEMRAREKGFSKKQAKEFLDSLAAEILLEDYLRNQSN